MSARVLRAYQSVLLDRVRDSIRAGAAPLAELPTGGGKTVIFAKLLSEFPGAAIAMAHRKELVAQISRSLAAEGVTHRIIAPRPTIRMIAAANSTAYGHSFVSPIALIGVASVDSTAGTCDRWAARVQLVVHDEAHHVLEDNKWGKARKLFPNAQVVGFTATPERADGKGLGAASDGIFTEIIRGPPMRTLIDDGHLCEYKLFAPLSTQLNLSEVPISSKTGDFSKKKLSSTMRSARVTGDVVKHYLRLAPGRLGITFVSDVEAAEEMAQAYREAGVPAAALSAKTPPAERTAAIKKFARRELLQLVNVDLFGEGFDLSSAAGVDVCVEVVSMVRPTHSFVVYAQQFGRALRLGPGKTHAIIIDHVGNTARFLGPPDVPRATSLEPRDRRSKGPDDVPQTRSCPECSRVYRRELGSCPDCGHAHVPTDRGSPAAVDGDLVELDPAVLAELRAAAARAVMGEERAQAYYGRMGLPPVAVAANVKRCRETAEAQAVLRQRIAEVCGIWRAAGADDARIHRKFYLAYGIDVLSAIGLKAAPARLLTERL